MYRTIPQLLVEAAERDPDGDWLRVDDGTLTFAGATSAVAGVAERLRERGIGHGDLVVLTARTTPPYLLSWLALVSLGAIAVPTNPASTAAELGGLLGQTQPRAVITDAELAPLVGGATVLDVYDLVGDWSAPAAAGLSVSDVQPDDIAVLIPTSGTTGRSKLVMQTHRAYAMAGEGFPYWMDLTAADRLMTSLPLFHVNAPAYSVLGSLACGAGPGLAAALLREWLPRRCAPARGHGVQRDRRDARNPDAATRKSRRRRHAAASLLHRPGADSRASVGRSRNGSGCASCVGYAMSESPVRPDLAAWYATVRHARHGAAAPDAGRGERGAGGRRRTAPTPVRRRVAAAQSRGDAGLLGHAGRDGGGDLLRRLAAHRRSGHGRRRRHRTRSSRARRKCCAGAVRTCHRWRSRKRSRRIPPCRIAVVGVPSDLSEEEIKAFVVAALAGRVRRTARAGRPSGSRRSRCRATGSASTRCRERRPRG